MQVIMMPCPEHDNKLLVGGIIMKYYTLEAIIKGKPVKFEKAFSTRDSAIDYMFKYYDKHFMSNLVVNEEISVNGDKHNIEYVCDDFDRFRIKRVTL